MQIFCNNNSSAFFFIKIRGRRHINLVFCCNFPLQNAISHIKILQQPSLWTIKKARRWAFPQFRFSPVRWRALCSLSVSCCRVHERRSLFCRWRRWCRWIRPLFLKLQDYWFEPAISKSPVEIKIQESSFKASPLLPSTYYQGLFINNIRPLSVILCTFIPPFLYQKLVLNWT